MMLLVFAVLVLTIVAFSTPYWGVITQSGGVAAFNLGFFDVCRSGSCSKYLTFFNMDRYTGEMAGCIIFMVLAILSLAVAFFFSFASTCDVLMRECCRGGCGTQKEKVMVCVVFTLLGGACELVTVVWFYVNTIRNYNGLNTERYTVTDTKVDYSFILAAVSAALAIAIPFFVCIYQFLMVAHDGDRHYDDYPLKPHMRPPSPEPVRRYAPHPPPQLPARVPAPVRPSVGRSYLMPDPIRLADRPIHNAPEEYRQTYGNQAPQVYRYAFKPTENFWRQENSRPDPREGYKPYSGNQRY